MRTFLLFALTFVPAWACSCGAWPSAKQAWEESPAVFVGRVERTEPDANSDEHYLYKGQTAWVRVEDPFKGVSADETLTLSQPSHNCAPKFKPGQSVLLYLYPTGKSGVWEAPGCYRSRDMAEAADDLLFLRALPGSAKGNRLSGTVELFERSAAEGFRKSKAISGIHVTVSGDGHSMETLTNADGIYELYGLAPGKYKVDVKVPRGLKLDFPVIQGPVENTLKVGLRNQEFELGPHSEISVDFVLMADNRMSGRVLDPEGKPMDGVCLELEPAAGKAGPYSVFDCTKSGGKYTLEEMPAGQYRIVANRSGRMTASEPFAKLYYPGVAERDKASVITIGTGETLTDLDIRVLAVAKRVSLSGRLQFNDRAPVPDSDVQFVSAEHEYHERTSTEADGSFNFSVIAGKVGELHGEIRIFRTEADQCPQFGASFNPNGFMTTLSTPPIAISTEKDQSGIILTLPFRSCKDWPDKQ